MMTPLANTPITMTELMLRLYVFLSQVLDRCIDTPSQESFPQEDLHTHLMNTRTTVMELLSVNPVVKRKIERECERIMTLSEAYRLDPPLHLDDLQRTRSILQHKTIALSDLLAVLRAMDH